MEEETKQLLFMCVAAVLITTAIAGSISYYYTTVDIKAMESGYNQRTIPGSSGVYWVKE